MLSLDLCLVLATLPLLPSMSRTGSEPTALRETAAWPIPGMGAVEYEDVEDCRDLLGNDLLTFSGAGAWLGFGFSEFIMFQSATSSEYLSDFSESGWEAALLL